MSEKPIEELLDEIDALQAKAVDLPYFVSADPAYDCGEHRNSGLALVDTGRSGDWPVARLCEWPTANFLTEVANAYPRLVRELGQRIERERQLFELLERDSQGRWCFKSFSRDVNKFQAVIEQMASEI